jgi:hypothetical protein
MTWALATIAVLLVAYAACSRRLQLMSVSSAMCFTTAGLLAGPVLGLLDLRLESLIQRAMSLCQGEGREDHRASHGAAAGAAARGPAGVEAPIRAATRPRPRLPRA